MHKLRTMLALLAALPSACAYGSQTRWNYAIPQLTASRLSAAATPSRPADDDCELWLRMEQLPGHGAYSVSSGHVGVTLVSRRGTTKRLAGETSDRVEVMEGACIQRKGQTLALPASFLVAGDEEGGAGLSRFCRGEAFPGYETTANGIQKLELCEWNGRFHSARPFTIAVQTTDSERSVGDYVDYLRVYRNGDLLAAWNRASDQGTKNRVMFPGTTLSTQWYAVSHPPHLAPIDLRIIPLDSVKGAVELTVRSDRALFAAELKRVFEGVAGVEPDLGSVAELVSCFRDKLKLAQHSLRRVVVGETDLLVQLGPGCGAAWVPDPGTSRPLAAKYDALTNASVSELSELRTKAKEQIGVLAGALEPAVAAASDQLWADLVAKLCQHGETASSCTNATFTTVARNLHMQIKQTLESVDNARALADRLFDDVKAIATQPAHQAELFNAVVQALGQQGDVFEARKENPPLLAGEQSVPMEYSDHFQLFALAPWNCVPLQVKQNKTDLSAAVAVPFLDLLGFRIQWAKTRFADFRVGAGIGYIQTENTGGETRPAALPQVSLGVATFKVGAGYALGKDIGAAGFDRVRILVGVDLFKLLTGNNVEVL